MMKKMVSADRSMTKMRIRYIITQNNNCINVIHIRYCHKLIDAKIVYYSANHLHAAGERM